MRESLFLCLLSLFDDVVVTWQHLSMPLECRGQLCVPPWVMLFGTRLATIHQRWPRSADFRAGNRPKTVTPVENMVTPSVSIAPKKSTNQTSRRSNKFNIEQLTDRPQILHCCCRAGATKLRSVRPSRAMSKTSKQNKRNQTRVLLLRRCAVRRT